MLEDMNRSSRLLPAAIATAALVLLAACGSSDDAEHNDADVAFAQQMVPHHEQAVEMTRLVPDADASPEVAALATEIEDAQAPEVATMRGWLDDWDADASSDGHDAEGHDMSGMSGMMSDADLARLGTLSGDAFDRAWLTMMIEHHRGAVEMARTELADGRDDDATRLAQRIVDTQRQEIATMEELLR
jgi:uncharacterized protein (DUF305 family)